MTSRPMDTSPPHGTLCGEPDARSGGPSARSGAAALAAAAVLLGLLLAFSGTALPANLPSGTDAQALPPAGESLANLGGDRQASLSGGDSQANLSRGGSRTDLNGGDRSTEAAMQQAMDEILVRILPAAEVQGDSFTLGEVAEFDGFDVDGEAALAKVAMGRSPAPGRPQPLSEVLVRSRIAGLVQADRVRLIVPKNAQVTRAAQTVRAQDIEAVVLSQALKDAGEEQEVKQELLTPVTDLLLPNGALEWSVEPVGRHLMPGGDRSYTVTARIDGKDAWRMPLRVRQKVYQVTVVAARPIRRDQVIQAEDVTSVRRQVNASKDGGYTGSLKSIVGRLAKRPIAQDEPISDAIVRAPAAVNEGGRVTVVYETPVLLMQVPGVALVSGQLGQFIPVRNLQTGKVVYGVIQPEDRVKVN